MPFIPPVSIVRSVSGLNSKERAIGVSSTTPVAKSRDDKGSSVKERLTMNLKQLGKKSHSRSCLPAAKGASGAEVHAKRKDRPLPSSQTDSFSASSSGESLSKTQQQKHGSQSYGGVGLKTRTKHEEGEARFTLTLTPEAVLLLQRRSSERRLRLATRHADSAATGASGSTMDSRRRRENVSKRQPPATQIHSAPNNRASVKNHGVAEPEDLSSILKVSLLNEQHKYDDVEYEEEGFCGVDEHVVLKCTEWLRGLENTPVTVGSNSNKSASSVKSFRR